LVLNASRSRDDVPKPKMTAARMRQH
jgi:hypothetical protein